MITAPPQQRIIATPPKARQAPIPRISCDEDNEIRLAVERSLRSSGYYSVREVRSLVEDGVVMLFGTLPSYYMKQIAQTVVMNLEMVMRVENHCEVVYTSHNKGSISQSTEGDD